VLTLGLLATCPAAAQATFDPPDGTVINANLPAIVPFAYQLDLDAICGAEQPALVSAWLRTPSGRVFQPTESRSASGAHEESFGADLTHYGSYEHWVVVRCSNGVEHTVEQGRFTIGGEEPGSPGDGGSPPGADPSRPERQGRAHAVPRRCRAARASLTSARKRLTRAKRALARRRTAQRRRAVTRARKQVKLAAKTTRRRCSR
jgi:hypothetical protein